MGNSLSKNGASKNSAEYDCHDDSLLALPDEMRSCTGLRILHDEQNPRVDIIFVHGLTGHREKTWTAPGSNAPWPQALLPKTVKHARILTFGYDARVIDWKVVSQNRIGNHSRNLLQAVADHRENDMTNNRPIIFVAHSLGGLICEDALITSSCSVEGYLQNIFKCTFGLAFMGTPHHGSDMAQWAETMGRFTSLFKQTNHDILRSLTPESEILARIQDQFHTLLRSQSTSNPPRLKLFCFYEELPLAGVGTVVPKDSAILAGYLHAGLPYDHRNMTKFASVDDPGFVTVTNCLRHWIREIDSLPTGSTKQVREPVHVLGESETILDKPNLLAGTKCAICASAVHLTSECPWEGERGCGKCNTGIGPLNVRIQEHATSAKATVIGGDIANIQMDVIIVGNMTIIAQSVPGCFPNGYSLA